MKHYGDITKLSGYTLPTVDVITGGSPCQDLSVAGKRAGLDGERSGLFMEQIRIVKEMRERDRANGRTGFLVRPRYCVWENVPGAFSSNGGKDFQAVLTEFAKIAEPGSPDVPMPEKDRWPKSGCIYDEMGRWSIAWRVHDAQFWGVPQRRKRIALVADFGGLSAPEILFERKGLSRDSEPSGAEREETAGDAGNCTETAIGVIPINTMVATRDTPEARTTFGVGEPGDPQFTLSAAHEHAVFCLQGNGIDRSDTAGCNGAGWRKDVSYTLNTIDRHGVVCLNDQGGSVMGVSEDVTGALRAQDHGHPPLVAVFKAGQSKAGGIGWAEEQAATLSANCSGTEPTVYDARGNGNGETVPMLTGDHQNRVTDYTALCVGNGQLNQISMAEQANTLDTMHDQQAVMCFQNTGQGWWNESDIGATIRTPCGGDSVKANLVSDASSIVRRLTPLECERLQGYPDGWTDIGDWADSKGKTHKAADSPRYKALGNSIALPFWQYLARRICAQYERDITMGSLFDGIGGFPLVFERCGAKAVWASEIEEFPIAATKKHFPEDKP